MLFVLALFGAAMTLVRTSTPFTYSEEFPPMSNGHPKQRRSGAPHARHGPQRVATPTSATSANGARANGQANNQPTVTANGASHGAKRQAKTNESRVTLQPKAAQPTRLATNAAPTPPTSAAQPKSARGGQSAPTPPVRPALPVVRRRGGGAVIVPPTGRASGGPADTTERPQAASGGTPPPDRASARPTGDPANGFVISLAQRDLESPIEATAVEMFSLTVERIDTVIAFDGVDGSEEFTGGDASTDDQAAMSGGAADGSNDASRVSSDNAANGEARSEGLDALEVGAESGAADTAPALPSLPRATPTPRARVGRFYAPGGALRPDETWVDRAPGAASTPASAERDGRGASAPPGRSSAPGFAVPAAPPPVEPYEHFDHSTHIGPRDELGKLIDSLHSLFDQDRAVASQTGAVRCGVCYLHFPLADLEYREQEGFYVCPACKHSLGGASIPMVRRQQR